MERAPYFLGGAALGAGLGSYEAHHGAANLRKKVEDLQSKDTGGFAHAFDLAQAKARLALAEVAEKHPVASTAMTALGFGMAGAAAKPQLESIGQSAKELF